MPIAWLRRWSERRRRTKRKPRATTYRFYDPCFGPTRESLMLPSSVRDAAEDLCGRRMGLPDALACLRRATDRYGGFLEIPMNGRHVLWHKPEGGGTHVFYLIRFK